MLTYIPLVLDLFKHIVGKYGFAETLPGVAEAVRALQDHAENDEYLVNQIIAIRRSLTPTGAWITEDAEAEEQDKRRKVVEQEERRKQDEEARRLELLAAENARKARVRAKKLAKGIDPSIERLPELLGFPPPIFVARENKTVWLRVRGKYIQTCRWHFNGKPIESEEFVRGIHHTTLLIPHLTKRVVGEYFCVCENDEGSRSTPTMRLQLVALSSTRLASRKLRGRTTSMPLYFDQGVAGCCMNRSLVTCEAKTLTLVKISPVIPPGVQSMAWFPRLRLLAVGAEQAPPSATKKPTKGSKSANASLALYSMNVSIVDASGVAATTTLSVEEKSPKRKPTVIVTAPVEQPKNTSMVTSQCLAFLTTSLGSVEAIAFTDNGRRLVLSDGKHCILVYRTQPALTLEHTIKIPGNIYHISASTNRSSFAVALQNSDRILWYGLRPPSEPIQHHLQLNLAAGRVALDPHGFALAATEIGCIKSWISILNIETRRPSKKRFVAHVGRVTHMEWTEQTSLLVSAGHDGYVKLWDLESVACVFSYHHDLNGVRWLGWMEKEAMFHIVGFSSARMEARQVQSLPEFLATRLDELHDHALRIQKVWKGGQTRYLVNKFIRRPKRRASVVKNTASSTPASTPPISTSS
ncbi:TPA: hypothetical protein N0F65_011263 [Lagenidium giganteum]|uniref:Guanine nucleotide-binding protein subunit beta-like protein n=1 Tax=Lagenidium giganteum TaxID=4803 RepID=A0AAV2Z0T9_9STRA|nr:TPA: hypothetical protein N0F65_011263 [Lagenidium giganteum]